MTYEIKDASEIPEEGRGVYTKYPFGQMKVGQVFMVPADDKAVTKVRNSAHSYGRIKGMKFSCSTQPCGGIRVERVE